jgi:Trk K+ transport system NAD-binding subunit
VVLKLKVIIAGAGDIGTELAERLIADDHDVVVLEKDSEKITSLSNKLDAMLVQETGQRIAALVDGGIEDADVFIAVTDSDELNIMFCMIAKKLAKIKTAARVRNCLGAVTRLKGQKRVPPPPAIITPYIFIYSLQCFCFIYDYCVLV